MTAAAAMHKIETLHEQFLLARQEALQAHVTRHPDDRDVWLGVQEEFLEEAEVFAPQTAPQAVNHMRCLQILRAMQEEHQGLLQLFGRPRSPAAIRREGWELPGLHGRVRYISTEDGTWTESY